MNAQARISPPPRQPISPTSLIIKLAPGETPDSIPTVRDVARGHQPAADTIDNKGPIDRITQRIAGDFKAARLFPAAAHPPSPGRLHLNYDSIEHSTGMAATLMMRIPSGADVLQLCRALSQVTSVAAVSPNYITNTPFDASASIRRPERNDGGWAARNEVGLRDALKIESGDSGVTVGLVDSGVNPAHPELQRRFRAGFDTVRLESADVSGGVVLVGDHESLDAKPRDLHVGHGMGCAGIIGASGLGMPRGLAGDCRLLPMRALAAARLASGKFVGIGSISDLDLALKLAVDLGAKVINLSFGTDDSALDPNAPKPHADTVAYAIARGCILVAASGNNGKETRYWPAAYPDVIAVGAVGDDYLPTSFSTRGDHVALCAPGEKVLTAAIDGYQLASGTSFAAPFVTAAAALLVSHSFRRARPIDCAMVRRLLVSTARPFPRTFSGCGAGVLDAAAALAALEREIDESPGYEAGQDADGGADDG